MKNLCGNFAVGSMREAGAMTIERGPLTGRRITGLALLIVGSVLVQLT